MKTSNFIMLALILVFTGCAKIKSKQQLEKALIGNWTVESLTAVNGNSVEDSGDALVISEENVSGIWDANYNVVSKDRLYLYLPSGPVTIVVLFEGKNRMIWDFQDGSTITFKRE